MTEAIDKESKLLDSNRNITKAKIRLTKVLSVLLSLYGLSFIFAYIIMTLVVLELGSEFGLDSNLGSVFGETPPEIFNSAINILAYAAYMALGIVGFFVSRKPKLAKLTTNLAIICLVLDIVAFALMLIIQASDLNLSRAVIEVVLVFATAAYIFLVSCFIGKEDDPVIRAEIEEISIDNPNHFGFLRVIEVLWVINILFTLAGLIFTSRNAVVYSFASLLDWANVVFEALAIWFIIKRFRAVRAFVLCYSAFNIISGAIYYASVGEFSLISQIFSSGMDIFLFIYFLTSRRVRVICTNKLHFGRDEKAQISRNEQGELVVKRKGWPFIRNLAIYYCVFSLLGHWMEAGCCMLMKYGILQGDVDMSNTMLWRDWFYPFPMEGLAVVLIALLLYPLKNWLVEKIRIPVLPYVLSFIANALVCVIIEFSMGLAVNAQHQLWDYTDMPFNFMGQVCLQNALGFGLACSIIGWIVYPALERAIAHVPRDVMNIVFVVILAAYAIPQTLYLIDPPTEIEEADSVLVEDLEYTNIE